MLSVRDLSVEYTSEGKVISAVNGVSFDLKRGRTLGLVGETGAGKTSTAKSIMRILPDISSRITGGEIYLEGKEILCLSEKEMRRIRGRKVSMIFQDPMTALNPIIKVGEQIREVIIQHNSINKKESVARAKEMLEVVGISGDRYHEYPHQFSGGMKQRVVIAIALSCNPELLLADEPTTALDVTIQAQVMETIKKLKEELNTSMLLITHDLGVVASACDDVAVIYGGEIIEMGSREVVFDNPLHPYTRGLFEALPEMEEDAERLKPIGGTPPDPSNLPKGCFFGPRCPHPGENCSTESKQLLEIEPGHFCRCGRAIENGEQ